MVIHMIKKISYLFIFVISLFSLNFVNAESLVIDDVRCVNDDCYNNFISDFGDDLPGLYDYIKEITKSHYLNYCWYRNTFSDIECIGSYFMGKINNFSATPGASYFITKDSSSYNYTYKNGGAGYRYLLNVVNDNNIFTFPLYFISNSTYDLTKYDYTYIFNDDLYDSFPSELKKYYDFKTMNTNDHIYSLLELLVGNFLTKTINLNVCISNDCSLDKSISVDIKYIFEDQEIDITEFLPKEYEDYILDTSKEYKIVPNSSDVINVYYVTEELDYNIYFYFDGELQSDRTLKRKGFSTNLITIDISEFEKVIDDIYFLDDSYDYSFTLTRDNNYINIYYHTIEVTYFVNVFLDDIYYQSHSLVRTGLLGSTIVIDDLEEVINIYTLDQREYKLSLTENQQLNYVNVYYYSNNYNTKYQDIDTSDKFYIAFDWVYIKELFNLHGEYTQTEQFVILYAVNILFYVIIGLFIYIGLKMLYKLLSFIGMF